MFFGITTFTLIPVVLSLVGIFAGLVVAGGLVAGKRLDGWTGVFLLTTVATSVSGFGFLFVSLLPSHLVAIFARELLTVMCILRYLMHTTCTCTMIFVLH